MRAGAIPLNATDDATDRNRETAIAAELGGELGATQRKPQLIDVGIHGEAATPDCGRGRA